MSEVTFISKLALESDLARTGNDMKNVRIQFSQKALASSDLEQIRTALRTFSSFGPFDYDHDLGRFSAHGNWYVFSIEYWDLQQTRGVSPDLEEVFRVIHVVTLSEVSRYSF